MTRHRPPGRGAKLAARCERPRPRAASSTVSTSVQLVPDPDGRPAAVQGGAGAGAGVGPSTSARRPGLPLPAGRAAPGPTSHRPRRGRGPRRGSEAASPPRAGRPAVTCGVSMPTWTTGPGPAASACALPGAPRARRRAVEARSSRRGCGAARRDGRRRESPVECQLALGERRRAGVDVSRRAAAASSAAAVHARPPRPSRVFTRPGTGALATTQRPHARPHVVDSTAQKSRAVRIVPRTDSDDLRRRAGGARAVGHVVLVDPPAGQRSPCAAARRG